MMNAAIHLYEFLRRRLVLAAVLVVLCGAGAVSGQALPRHFDPDARQASQTPASLPALRFLTTADYPPFNYRDPDGTLVGYNIDLAQAVCDELKTVCTVQVWPWDQAADALADNQGDALIGGLALTADTAARFDFSAIYLRFPARFVVASGAFSDFSPEALAGKKLAVRAGSEHQAFAMRYLPKAELIGTGDEFAALDLVRNGVADAYFGDGLRAAFWLGQNAGCCAFAGGSYFRPDYFGEGLAIAVTEGRRKVTDALDTALQRLEKSGKLDELYLRWFPVGFY